MGFSRGFLLGFLLVVVAGWLFAGLTSCRSLRPYEKEHLLKPAMDDGRISALEPTFAKSTVAQFEKLGSGAGSGGGGSSCPTCGI